MGLGELAKILVIEDSKVTRDILLHSLGSDFELSFAENGQQAQSYLARTKFDLIILDINLPDTDGFRLCTQIRGRAQTANIPIIFLSGEGRVQSKVAGLALGGDDYVTKPFSPLELKARMLARLRSSVSGQGISEAPPQTDIGAEKVATSAVVDALDNVKPAKAKLFSQTALKVRALFKKNVG